MDMLVKLYDLPDSRPLRERLTQDGVSLRARAGAREAQGDRLGARSFLRVLGKRSRGGLRPRAGVLLHRGQGRHDHGLCLPRRDLPQLLRTDRRRPNARKGGVGTALLLACLEDMKHAGYGYAIIGGVGPADYYARAVGAVAIEGSDVGVYRGLLGASRFSG